LLQEKFEVTNGVISCKWRKTDNAMAKWK